MGARVEQQECRAFHGREHGHGPDTQGLVIGKGIVHPGLLEGLVCGAFSRIHPADGIDIQRTVPGAGGKDTGIKCPDQFSRRNKQGHGVGTGIRDYDIVSQVLADLKCNPDLFRAGLVGVRLESGIGRGVPVQAGDDHSGQAAFFDLVKDLCTAADMLARTLAADNAPVFYLVDPGNPGEVVAHRVTQGDPLDLFGGAEAAEICNGKAGGLLARQLELPGL